MDDSNSVAPVQPGRSAWWKYALSILVTLATLCVRIRLGSLLGGNQPLLILFVFPIIVSAYLGGLGPGLISTLMIAVGVNFFPTQPTHLQAIFLGLNGILISALCEELHGSRRRAVAADRLQDQLARIAASAPVAVYSFRLRPDGSSCFPYVSPAFEQIFGLRPEDLARDGTAAFNAMHPEDRDRVRAAAVESARALSPWHVEFRSRHPQKGIVWVEGRSMPEREPDGSTLWHGSFSDVTERMNAESALQHSEKRYRSLFENMLNGFAFCRMIYKDGTPQDFVYLNVNPAFQRITGLTNVAGRKVSEVIPGILEKNPDLIATYGRVAATGKPEQLETYVQGLGIWFSISIYGPEPEHFVAVFIDITERKMAEKEMRLFRALVDQSNDTFEVVDPESGRFLDVNEKGPAELGFTRAEYLALRVFDIDPTIDPAKWKDIVQEVRESGSVYGEGIHRRKDGTTFPVEYNATRVFLDREYIVAVLRDITSRRQAEEGLRLQGVALNAAANAIAITDRAGVIEWINPAFAAVSGYTQAEAVGKNSRDLIKSGQHDAAFYSNLWNTIVSGQVWHGEITNRRKDGTLYTEDMTITPVRNRQNEITHFIAIKQDITEHKKLEAQLLRTQRLESVGRLASGIAHDLNNILSPVMMAPPVLREVIQDPEILEIVDSIESSAKRGAAVIRQLLSFGRGVQGKRAPIHPGSLVREMGKIIHETFPKNITLRQVLPPDLALVNGDETQLHQVLLNLCVNARDAMPDGGTLTLALEQIDVDDSLAQMNAGASTGPYVVLTVTDTGTGIAPDNLDKIFDPFFTTKGIGEGTGLGLSTVLGIARSHKGFIQVDTRPMQGTQFKVFLPACGEPGAAAGTKGKAITPHGRGESILLVDDENDVRRVARQVLEQRGYTVFEARNGGEALAVYQEHRAHVRAVVTDLVMPAVDGLALIRALRESFAPVKIVAISGQLSAQQQLRDVEHAVDAFISKPFSTETLLQTLEKILAPQAVD